MARTARMSLIELMVLKQDVYTVLEYIGKKGSFQFQTKKFSDSKAGSEADSILNFDVQYYNEIKNACTTLNFTDFPTDLSDYNAPGEGDREDAKKFLLAYNELQKRFSEGVENLEKSTEAYKEAMAFSNLKVSYSELESLSFISLKLGKIPVENYDDLKDSLMSNAVLVPLGNDRSRVLVASSKKGRFAAESILKEYGFVPLEIPTDFKGVPEDMLMGLRHNKEDAENRMKALEGEKKNFIEAHAQIIKRLIGNFAIGMQISEVETNLQSTELVYRITGWVPETEFETYMRDLDEITESRIAIRKYNPLEVPSVISGKEQVPVKLEHGKFVKSFERMIFSYGSPMYGTIDPTPFVAVFFTLLFGIMFGDCGQGLIFLLAGILMAFNVIKVGGWNKFAPIFMAIGVTSTVMGLLTGEFFSDEKLLEPFAMWITGLFGRPHAPIVKMMPSSDPSSIVAMFSVFGVAVAIGFVINTIGLIINIVNNIILKRFDEALFGKNGLAGALFFWYVVVMVIRIAAFHHVIALYDWIVIAVTLFFAAFASPFERAMRHESPLLENGFGTYLISGVVELIEVISGYLSNTVSFVRVGAFALSHAVLDFLILTLTELCGGAGGLAILIIGNAIIIVLEGMIVAIQVIRLQYYEFFSKFFHETGREFKPFVFKCE